MCITTTPGRRTTRLTIRAGAVLAAPLLAAALCGPATAAGGPPAPPDLPPTAGGTATTATTTEHGGGPPPAPPAEPPAEEAQVPEELPAAPAEPPAAPPGGVSPGGSAGSTGPTQPTQRTASSATPVVDTTEGERVVVCKYVRKPFVAEIAHHVVIVNEQALVGRGFPGTFPWAFSDAHFHSVAIRWAADGEQASGLSIGECPRPTVEEPPGGTDPGGTDSGNGSSGGDLPVLVPRGVEAPVAAGPSAGALPQTGAPNGLEALLLVSSAALLGGIVLRLRAWRAARS